MRSQAFHAELRAGSAPTWVKALGPVPTRKRTFRRWVRAAGEVEALRRTYNVPDSEPAVLPARMVHEASQRVNNARLAAEGAPVVVQSAEKTRAAEAVIGILEQVKRVGKAARLSERAKQRSGEMPVQEQVSKEKMMSETEERLRREREARAERVRQMVERTRSLDDRLRNQPDDQAQRQQRAAQQRQMQERQAQQMHEQARRGVRGPGVS